jgi:molecular chaperone DnaK (HSP70)
MKVFESDVTDVEKDENGRPKDKEIEDRFAKLIHDKVMHLKGSYPRGTPIKVTFEIDNEGILSVQSQVADEILHFTLEITGVRNQEELAKARGEIEKMRME